MAAVLADDARWQEAIEGMGLKSLSPSIIPA
jgi:hypothetical protein